MSDEDSESKGWTKRSVLNVHPRTSHHSKKSSLFEHQDSQVLFYKTNEQWCIQEFKGSIASANNFKILFCQIKYYMLTNLRELSWGNTSQTWAEYTKWPCRLENQAEDLLSLKLKQTDPQRKTARTFRLAYT